LSVFFLGSHISLLEFKILKEFSQIFSYCREANTSRATPLDSCEKFNFSGPPWLFELSLIAQMIINFAYPPKTLSSFIRSPRYETKRWRLYFRCLALLSLSQSRKIIRSSSKGVHFFYRSSHTENSFFFDGEISQNLEHRCLGLCSKTQKNSSFQQFLRMMVEFECLQKISSYLLRIFAKIWLRRNSGSLMEKATPLEISSYWKAITPESFQDYMTIFPLPERNPLPKGKVTKNLLTLKILKFSLIRQGRISFNRFSISHLYLFS